MTRRLLYVLFLVLLFGFPTAAQSGEPTQSRMQRVDAAVVEYMKAGHIPGTSVAIVAQGRIVYAGGYGSADLENKVPVTTETVFPSASTAKPLTATAILQLRDAGKLNLLDPIQRYCPAYPGKKWPVTILNLLRHQSGVPPSTAAIVFNREHFLTVNAAVAAFASLDLQFEPGTKTAYSNDGYTLLACAIEGSSGMSYDRYVQKYILDVAGMSGTKADDWYKVIPNRSRSYVIRTEENTKAWKGLWTEAQLSAIPLNAAVNADPLDPTRNPGAAGYLMNPTDLAMFALALESHRLLSPSTVREMVTEQSTHDGQVSAYGLSWVVKPLHGERSFRVFGSVWSGSSALMVLPDRNFAIAICTNVEFEQPVDLAVDLARIWGFMTE